MVTLTAWVQSWIERRSIRLAPSTISGYNRLLVKYITPSSVGAMAIDQVAPEDLIVLLSPIVAKGYTRAAQLCQVLLGAALRDAVRQRIIPWSPMDSVDRIHHRKRCTGWLSVDQAGQLLAVSKAADDPYYIAWLLGLCCGLRRGELLGLMWCDVDLAGGMLHVRRQRVRVDGRIIEGPPKTDASVRDIPLSPEMITALRNQRRSGTRYVLEQNNRPVSDCMLKNALRRALERADLPGISLHGLRHTMAATAASQGVPIKVMQTIMGHAQYSTTADVYAHVDRGAMRQAAEIIALTTLHKNQANSLSELARLEIV